MTVAIDHVPVRTNEKLRESRLFPSMWTYIRRNGVSIFRIYAMYEPLRVFMTAAILIGLVAAVVWGRFAYFWISGRRRRPRAVADPRRRAVQRGDGAGGARRARRPALEPADHAAADLRARAARGARARGAAVALRARPPAADREPTTGARAGQQAAAAPRSARRSAREPGRHARRRGHGHRQHLRQVRLHQPGRQAADGGLRAHARRAVRAGRARSRCSTWAAARACSPTSGRSGSRPGAWSASTSRTRRSRPSGSSARRRTSSTGS